MKIRDENSLNIRIMKETDLTKVSEIERLSHITPWSDFSLSKSFQGHYLNYVLLDKTEIIGFCITTLVMDEMHLLNIAIHPSQQKKGHGKFLFHQVIDAARNKHLKWIFLEVRPSNLAAIHLYESLGFKKVATRKNYYKTNNGFEDAWVMEKEL